MIFVLCSLSCRSGSELVKETLRIFSCHLLESQSFSPYVVLKIHASIVKHDWKMSADVKVRKADLIAAQLLLHTVSRQGINCVLKSE